MATATLYKAKTPNGLIKKYHVLCGQLGLGSEQQKFLLWSSYSVLSSKDLNYSQLLELVQTLEKNTKKPEPNEYDKWRKRLMGAIGGWLKSIGKAADADIIKKIACRAAKCSNFNKIPLEQLRGLRQYTNGFLC